jgi:cell division protein FtsB
MNPYTIISLGSLLVSVITAIMVLFGHQHTTKTDFISALETRVEALERELKEAKEHINELEKHNGVLMKENIELLRKIARMGNGS